MAEFPHVKILFYLIFFKLGLALAAVEPAKLSADNTSDPRTEKNIARVTATLLEKIHYSQHPFDDDISAKLLDRYLDTLDPQHSYFLQADAAEFEEYRTKLDDLTAKGDTRPAHLIFARMFQRAQERIAFVNELLTTEKFTFNGEDRYTLDRRHLPRPKDLEEAHQLWRQNLRAEFLQEKLSAPDTNKLHAANLKKGPSKFTALNNNSKPIEVKTDSTSTNKTTNTLTQTEEIVKKLSKRYSNLNRTLKELGDDDVLELFLNSLARVYDPHSDYMGSSHYKNFNISMTLSLIGIGALLESEDGYCKIKELMAGPAMLSKKIKPGDRIVAVAQGDKEPVNVVDMKLNRVVELIRGTKGSEVRLTVWPGDAPDSSTRKIVTLIRDVIKLEDQEAKTKVIEFPGQKENIRLGVIDLPSFYMDPDPEKTTGGKSTTADIAKLLKKLNKENVDGIILDLRRNGGGLLVEAVNLTGLFITNGPVVQVKDASGETQTMSDTDSSIAYKGPLIVLTSHFSASASEILAGALQDYGRALIVGDSSTFGKGTVQKLIELNPYFEQNHLPHTYNPGALKPTNAKFYRAGGSSTQLRGVIPDLKLPTELDFAEVGEASLENPLPWDEVTSARFQKWNLVKPYVAELQKRSDQRLEKDKDFSYVREDIEKFKERLKDKSISLNEEGRRLEQKENVSRAEARKKEIKSRKPSEQKIFEVTLKNVDQPGLQPFVPKTNDLALAKTATLDSDEEALEALEQNVPPLDATLEEAERILRDYISLVAKEDHDLSKVE